MFVQLADPDADPDASQLLLGRGQHNMKVMVSK